MKMVDGEWLNQWFEPRHVNPERFEEYRRYFEDHPARCLVVEEVLRPETATSLGQFLEFGAPFRDSFGLFSRGRVDENDWQSAPEEDRFFHYRILGDGPPRNGLTRELFEFARFRQVVQDPRFRDLVEGWTGLQLGTPGQNVHAMVEGDFLKPHNDHDDNRRLAFIFYLSSDWQEAFGGALAIRDHQETVTVLEPRANRLVLFDILGHGEHWVTPVTSEARGRPRLSIGGWFSNPEGSD